MGGGMAIEQLRVRYPAREEFIVVIGSLSIGEMSDEMAKQQRPVGEFISLDGDGAAKTVPPFFVQCGREAFTQSAWTGKKINNGICVGVVKILPPGN
jgi:hypothetical protein